MADNIDVSPGSGRAIRTDLIAGVDWVCDKIAWGADGTATLVAAAVGSGLPIEGIAGGTAVPISGTVTANAGTGTMTVDGSGVTQPVSIAAAQTLATVTTVDTVTAVTTVSTVTSVTDIANTVTVDGTGTLAVQAAPTPVTTGGLTIDRLIGAATTNATSTKGSVGQLYGVYVSNVNASPVFLKLYNKASAPTVGTDVPVMTLLIPGNASGVAGAFEFSMGIAFATGIAFAITGLVADADTTAVAANEQVVHLLYK